MKKFAAAFLSAAVTAGLFYGDVYAAGNASLELFDSGYYAKTAAQDQVMISVTRDALSTEELEEFYTQCDRRFNSNFCRFYEDMPEKIIFYRDGRKISEQPACVTFFYDKGLAPGTYEYSAEFVMRSGKRISAGEKIRYTVSGDEIIICRRAYDENSESLRVISSCLSEEDYENIAKLEGLKELTVILEGGAKFKWEYFKALPVEKLAIYGDNKDKTALDINGASALQNVKELKLVDGRYDNVDFIGELSELEKLDVQDCYIGDCGGIERAVGLKEINAYLDCGRECDISKLTNLEKLCWEKRYGDTGIKSNFWGRLTKLSEIRSDCVSVSSCDVLPDSLRKVCLTGKDISLIPLLRLKKGAEIELHSPEENFDEKLLAALERRHRVEVNMEYPDSCIVFAYDTDLDGLWEYDEEDLDMSDLHNVDADDGCDFGCDPDYDGDGLGDGWEALCGLSIYKYSSDGISCDAKRDIDGDGLSALAEFRNGSYDIYPDSDRDGLTDRDEIIKYHTDPYDNDSDFDGLKDKEELELGLDPNNICSYGETYDNKRLFEQKVSGVMRYDGSEENLKFDISGQYGGILGNRLTGSSIIFFDSSKREDKAKEIGICIGIGFDNWSETNYKLGNFDTNSQHINLYTNEPDKFETIVYGCFDEENDDWGYRKAKAVYNKKEGRYECDLSEFGASYCEALLVPKKYAHILLEDKYELYESERGYDLYDITVE